MNQSTYLLTLSIDSDLAVKRVTRRLSDDGFHLIRSFDLKTAREAHTNCICPSHSTDECDCQLIVLLVYSKHGQPITLVMHSQDGKTHFEVVDFPNKRPQRLIITAILQALALEGFAAIRQSNSLQAS